MTASENGDKAKGAAPLGEDHWSKSRAGENEEALEYYRERSKAPGVEDGGGMRNHYCFECDGVIELEYDSRQPAPTIPETCPHCGAKLEGGARRMFNWVELDQPPGSDARALLYPAIGGLIGLAVITFLAIKLFA
ncbi:MAG: hypothetical protein MK291_11885 [Planctomycetes bacterium]|nr:hypothetical protein [Planctomycetota bacterium]